MKNQDIVTSVASRAARRKKSKLAFEELEKEMELLLPNLQRELKGGYSGTLPGDCMIEAVAFATGKSYNEVLDDFGTWAASQSGWNSNPAVNELMVVNSGMDGTSAAGFAQFMGLTKAGDVPEGPNGYSVSGDQSVAFLDLGGGSGHAIVLTGNANLGEYSYYDPQNGTTGTISKNDSRFAGTYGYW